MSVARRLTWAAWMLAVLPLGGADLAGKVTAQGLPVPGATVTLVQAGRTLTAYTGADGGYRFRDLPGGDWQLSVTAFGFTPVKGQAAAGTAQADWQLEVQKTAAAARPATLVPRGNFQRMQMNRVSEQEVVSQAPAPAEPAPAANEAAAGQSATEAFLVNGSLSRGLQTQEMGPPGGMRPPGGPGMEHGPLGEGGPGRDGTSMRGGMEGGRPPMMGGPGVMRGPGGRPEWMGQRGVTAFGNRRGGMNQMRGMATLSLNNSAFDARPYSLTGIQTEKTPYAQYRFGVNVGGPLKIPKLIDSPNTFFFFNYNGSRSDNPFSRSAIVPTALERTGDFSQSLVRGNAAVIYDPLSRLPFADNALPAARIDAAAARLTSYFPLPTSAGGVQNYQLAKSNHSNSDDLSVRLNQTLNTKNRINGSYSWQRRDASATQLFNYVDLTSGTGQRASLGWSHSITMALVSNLSFNFSRNRNDATPHFSTGADIAGQLGIQGTSRNPISFGPPDLSFTNFGGLTDGAAARRADQSFNLSEGVNWSRGKHNLNAGFQLLRSLTNSFAEPNGRGAYTFSGYMTSAFDARGNALSGTGFDFADFLLGLPQSSTIRYGNADTYLRAHNWSVYAGDDWRLRSNLTVNMGMRYDYWAPFIEKYDRLANLDIASGYTGVALVTAAGGAVPRGLIDPDRNNWSPRIGIAWRPWPKHSLQIRTGYGVYYNGGVYGQLAGRLAQQPPFAVTTQQTTTLQRPLTIENGFLAPAASNKLSNTFAVNRGFRVGYGQTWNFMVQGNLRGGFMLEAGYLGTKGSRLDVQRLPNQAAPGSAEAAAGILPLANAVGFTLDDSVGNSIYHAGQVRLMRRMRSGLSFNSFYTFGKSIDDVSTFGGGRAVVAQDNSNLRAERGISSFNRTHSWMSGFMFTSPIGAGTTHPPKGVIGALLRDWMLNSNFTVAAGAPLTAYILGNRSSLGGTGVTGSSRADATGLPLASGTGYFNPLAFALPAATRYGNAGRNTITGPASFVMSGSAGRSFRPFGERRSVEFRLEGQNLLNAVNVSGIGTTVNAADYGLASQAGAMRRISAEIRFRF